MAIRKIIVTTLGHVDHGKSSLLDKIRGTTIVECEAGRITQAIGASIIPIETVKRVCGHLIKSINVTIPGFLAIDTPGHAAFTTLRKRGGNLADIAIVVVDINEGFKPQTVEAIGILKESKTPFIIAANKIDLISGWRTSEGSFLTNFPSQGERSAGIVETKLYEIVGKIATLGFDSERFDRVNDYTKQIAIVPISAVSGEGLPELLMVLTGLAQRYLEQNLEIDADGPARGTILEVKEDKGLGSVIDVILFDGTLRVNDILVIGGIDGAITTKVKALLEPAPLCEMRDKKPKFNHVKEVTAATGVRISAHDLKGVIAGMPIASCSAEDAELVAEELQQEVSEVLLETDQEGIIIKADTIGGLEALTFLLKEKGIKICKARVGDITHRDITEAEAFFDKDRFRSVILGFNIKCEIAETLHVKVIANDVIYKIIEDFEEWIALEKKRIEEEKLDKVTRPCKFEIMRGYVFRQNNPAVVGVSVLSGTLRPNTRAMNISGKVVGTVKGLQLEQKNVDSAERNKQVAASIDGVTVGRQINEGDILFVDISEDDFRKLKEFRGLLSYEEKEILKEIAQIKRKDNPVWGV